MKDAVLNAIDELCIGDLTPLQAAERLMDLADESTLGDYSEPYLLPGLCYLIIPSHVCKYFLLPRSLLALKLPVFRVALFHR